MVAYDAVAPRPRPAGLSFAAVSAKDAERLASIEAACFHPEEATPLDVFVQRIAAAPELFLVARDTSTGDIVAFISGTLTAATRLTPESMVSHDPNGSLLCIHSVAVASTHRGMGLGPQMLQSYLETVRKDPRVRAVALLAHDELLGLYEKHGFQLKGRSAFALGPRPFNEMLLAL